MARDKDRPNGLLVAAGIGAGALLAARAVLRRSRYMDLRDKTVLIAGGSRGLGLELARQCAEQGARIAFCARNEEEIQRARQELGQMSGQVLGIQCDITIPAQTYEMVRGVIGHFGGIDVLMNVAGVIQVGPMEEMTLEDYQEAMATHFWGPLYTTTAVLPVMRARRSGRIVNITSIGGKVPAPHLLPYTASKFAAVGFSEGLRAELLKDNIFVTTVVPGLFRSGSTRHALFKGRHHEEYAWFATSDVTPLLSQSPRQLARRIINATQHGDAELISPWNAKLGVRLHGLCPGMTTCLASLANMMLPKPGGIGRERRTGAESSSGLVPKFARQRNRAAAQQFNEVR